MVFYFGCSLLMLSAFCIGWLNADRSYDGIYHSTPDPDTQERSRNSILCMDIQPQHMLNIEQILGLWYGNEIITHTYHDPGVFQYNTCVVVHLSDVTEQMRAQMRNKYMRPASYDPSVPAYPSHMHAKQENDLQMVAKYLRLDWSERNEKLEYTFNYTDHEPGLWMNVGEQRVTLLTRNRYNQFTGSVQVVKAVHDHIVLTFCGNDLHNSIYTIVLTRVRNGLNDKELSIIRKMLKNRGLNTDSVRRVCVSGAQVERSLSWLLLIALLAGQCRTAVKLISSI